MSDQVDAVKMGKSSCDWPSCPSKWIGDELVQELRVIQTNQKNQSAIQEKMLDHQIVAARMLTDITHVKEDMRKIDGRIATLFQTKVDEDKILPKQDIITKGDLVKVMAYTAAVTAAVFTIMEFFGRWITK